MNDQRQLEWLQRDLERLQALTPNLERQVSLTKYGTARVFYGRLLDQNRNEIDFTLRKIQTLQIHLNRKHARTT